MCHNLRTIVLSVILRFTASDYPFGIFKHFLSYDFPLAICFVFVRNKELILLYSICLLKIIHTAISAFTVKRSVCLNIIRSSSIKGF